MVGLVGTTLLFDRVIGFESAGEHRFGMSRFGQLEFVARIIKVDIDALVRANGLGYAQHDVRVADHACPTRLQRYDHSGIFIDADTDQMRMLFNDLPQSREAIRLTKC